MPVVYLLSDRFHVNDKEESSNIENWRVKTWMKTVSLGVVLCLNIGTDPPDVVKPMHCARMECWIDPFSMSAPVAIKSIAKALRCQYERWQPKIRCLQLLDPTVEDCKKQAQMLRQMGNKDRVLWHYNGHGVPRPTGNGEIWVFNKNYTQYLPLAIRDLKNWLGNPTVYVLDCCSAGILLPFFEEDQGNIVLAACGADEVLPMDNEFPADLFTSCLTTPITIALRWFMHENPITMKNVSLDVIDKIPGELNDRKTPIGELNWIFTAITDTIAWNTFGPDLFQKLYRQDGFLSSMFRNYLLAERVMQAVGCTPCSIPALPSTYDHELWKSWDLAAERCLSQVAQNERIDDFQMSPFFAEQLTAFEIWLNYATKDKHDRPEQLPVILQVLLSQPHRLRALILLKKFLDLGPWAVQLALSVYIFPYMLKLLRSSAVELRQILVFIWAKILAADSSCRKDLVAEQGHLYFIKHLAGYSYKSANTISSPRMPSEQKVMAVFILAIICEDYRQGKVACFQHQLHRIVAAVVQEPNTHPLLRQWVCFCLSNLWEGFDEAKIASMQLTIPNMVLHIASNDTSPHVRAAAIYALGTFIGISTDSALYYHGTAERNNATNTSSNSMIGMAFDRMHNDVRLALDIINLRNDASPLVRKQILCTVAKLAFHAHHMQAFVTIAGQPKSRLQNIENVDANNIELKNLVGPDGMYYGIIWNALKRMQTEDLFPKVANTASKIVCKINAFVLEQNRNFTPSSENTVASSLQESGIAEASMQREGSMPNLVSAILRGKTANKRSPSSISVRPSQSFGNLPGLEANPSVSDTTAMNNEAEGSVPFPKDLESTLYTWCRNNFNSSNVLSDFSTDDENVDPLSIRGATKLLQKAKNAKFIEDAIALRPSVSSASNILNNTRSLNASSTEQTIRLRQYAVLDNDVEMTSLMLFHPYDDHTLIAADNSNRITVWNYKVNTSELEFQNLNPKGSRITSLKWINEEDISLLLCASDDGSIKFWYGLHEIHDRRSITPRMVTAFSAVPDLVSSTRGSGVVTSWLQQKGHLLVGGNSKNLRVYDLDQERCIRVIPTDTEACITSLDASDKFAVAGCSNGAIKLYDTRVALSYAQTAIAHEHEAWIVNTKLQPGGHELMTGSVSGIVKLWDLRNTKSATYTYESLNTPMTAFDVHEYSPVFACGSHNQFIKLFSRSGDHLTTIRYHDGFLGERIGPVSCLAFHPHRFLLAAGATDSIIAVYAKDKHL